MLTKTGSCIRTKQDNSFSHEPNLANIRHIRGYCRMGAYIREFIEIFNKGKGKKVESRK